MESCMGSVDEICDEDKPTKVDREDEGKQKKPKPVGLLSLFRFTTRSERILLLIGLLLAAVHSCMMPAMLIVFAIAVQYFADHYNSNNFFHCQKFSNCSAVLYCSNISNGSRCCLDDSFDCVTNDSLLHQIDFIVLYCVIIGIIMFASGWGHASIFHFVGNRQLLEIRKRLFRAIVNQSMEWFDVNATGEITSKVTEKLDNMQSGLGESLSVTFQSTVTFLVFNALSFFFEWRVALFLLGNWPFVFAAAALLKQLQQQQTAKDEDDQISSKADYGKAGALAEEMLSAIRTVTSFGGQDKLVERYGNELEYLRKHLQKKALLIGIVFAALHIVGYSLVGGSLWFSGWLLENLDIKFSNIVGAGMCSAFATLALLSGNADIENVGKAMEAAKLIFNIIGMVPTIDVTCDGGIIPDDDFSYSIKFNDVKFAYPSRPDIQTLNGLNLSVAVGQSIGVVGASGSGKSTIVKLLQRFYDIKSGELLIGGYEIDKLNLRWLRQQIGVVSQEPVLFASTIAENISYGREDITKEEIEEAAKAANAHSFITELPDGYDTLVGEKGTQLSGGQKQRLAIARVLIKDPKILLLDEATSALDTQSEALVQAALDKASAGRTTIVIAHRLSTIKRVDLIVVMDKGKIVEFGRQQELLNERGIFYNLMVAQLYSEQYQWTSHDEDVDHIVHDNKLTKIESGSDMIMSSRVKLATEYLDDHEDEQNALHVIKNSKLSYLLLAILGCSFEGIFFALINHQYVIGAVKSYLEPSTASQTVQRAVFILISLGILSSLAVFTRVYCFNYNGGILTARLRKLSLAAMLRQEIGWFDLRYNWTGALVSRLAVDAALVQNVIGIHLGVVITMIMMFACITVVTYTVLDASAASIILVTLLPLAIVPLLLRSSASVDIARDAQIANEESNHVMFESIVHIHTVTSFNLQEMFLQMFESFSSKEPSKYAIMIGAIYALVEVIPILMFAIMLRFGAYLVTLRDLHRFHTSFINILVPLYTITIGSGLAKHIGHSIFNYIKAKNAAKVVFTLLHRVPAIDAQSTRGITPDRINGEILFEKVTFSYPTREGLPIFKRVSFTVLPGQTLAIVGPSGCGKSTVTALLERFYDPLSGSIKLDHIDIRVLNLQWLRQQIGLVSQEPVLFDSSIADNIRHGANYREVTDEEIVMAARSANIHDFIMSLPQGYDSVVGPGGGQLSGGQKQRVAIARALVRNPKILILDEATSALDTESEKVVEEALDNAAAGRTCIKIAHRIATVRNADKIIVISNGRVVESGTHSELMLQNGVYHAMNSC